jgi:hypothetical protein
VGLPILGVGFNFYGITYSIVDFTLYEILLGGVAVVINIEIVGFSLSFLLYLYFSEDYLFLYFLVLHLLAVLLKHSVFSLVTCGIKLIKFKLMLCLPRF